MITCTSLVKVKLVYGMKEIVRYFRKFQSGFPWIQGKRSIRHLVLSLVQEKNNFFVDIKQVAGAFVVL